MRRARDGYNKLNIREEQRGMLRRPCSLTGVSYIVSCDVEMHIQYFESQRTEIKGESHQRTINEGERGGGRIVES